MELEKLEGIKPNKGFLKKEGGFIKNILVIIDNNKRKIVQCSKFTFLDFIDAINESDNVDMGISKLKSKAKETNIEESEIKEIFSYIDCKKNICSLRFDLSLLDVLFSSKDKIIQYEI